MAARHSPCRPAAAPFCCLRRTAAPHACAGSCQWLSLPHLAGFVRPSPFSVPSRVSTQSCSWRFSDSLVPAGSTTPFKLRQNYAQSHICPCVSHMCPHDWTHATGARPAALAAGPHTSRQGSPVPHSCRAGQAEPRQLSQTRRLQGCRHGRGRAAAPASAGSGRARSRTSCCAPAAPASACTRPCWGGRPAAGTPPAVSLPAVGGAAPAPQSQTDLPDSPVFRPAL